MKLTSAQRAVITPERGHLLVDAGAGSGKTTTVVQALCHQLGVSVADDGAALPPVTSPLSFEQVAAITFTNQAAADLKRKLRHALRIGGRRDLSAEVDSARIGTIHGFCGDLLRDFALRSGARPGRRVLEEGEASALAGDCALDALHAAIAHQDVEGLDTLLAGRKLKNVGEWVTTLSSDADRLARLADGRDALRDHERALLDIAERAVTLRTDRLDRDGLLDFDRMIVAVRDMLLDDAVRHAAQQQIRLLVLDEFQDVDPTQRDIAFLLGGLAFVDPAPSRLILVGDPKQSIYRFRRADVTLWNEVAAHFAEGAGTTQPMQENFRSKAAILGLVDDFVGTALQKAVAASGERQPFEVDYASLIPKADHHQGDHAVEFLTVVAADDGKQRKVADVRSVEAFEVARRIEELHKEGTAYGDVAILLAGWGAAETYTDALRSAGIPYYTLRSEGFWEEREIIDCLLALRAIRDITDDVAVAGYLKSPFVGVR
ncbi:MAG: ATP-dependent helicase, partial [Gemmatimonadaceae bacterium]|nr:ATP-dependent helicase [Gemmatimonadaceae bacterium]